VSDWLGMSVEPRVPRPELKARVLARALAARPARRWPLAAAAGIVIALAVSGLLWRRVRRLETGLAAARDTLDLVRSPGSPVVAIPVSFGSRTGLLTVFSDTASDRLLVTCRDFPENAPGQTYQMWFVTDHGMRSAGLMNIEEDYPMVTVVNVPDEMRVTGFAMSVEPRGGSPQPHGRMLFHVNL
jgi:anti-sigma-K factor RskA